MTSVDPSSALFQSGRNTDRPKWTGIVRFCRTWRVFQKLNLECLDKAFSAKVRWTWTRMTMWNKFKPSVAHLWAPQVSPAASINFTGWIFSRAGNICDTSGGTGTGLAMRPSVSTRTWQTDTARHHRPRLCTASRGLKLPVAKLVYCNESGACRNYRVTERLVWRLSFELLVYSVVRSRIAVINMYCTLLYST